jgi:hypothetical protein
MSNLRKFADTQQQKPKYRLTQLSVNEVSVVDRAANGYRFLITKSKNGDPTMKVRKANLVLPPTVKENLMAILEPSAKQLQDLLDAVKGAKEDEAAPLELPAEFGGPLTELCDSLCSILSAGANEGAEAAPEGEVPAEAPAAPEEVEAAAPAAPKPGEEEKAPAAVEAAKKPSGGSSTGWYEQAAKKPSGGSSTGWYEQAAKPPTKVEQAAPAKPTFGGGLPKTAGKEAGCGPDEMKKGMASLQSIAAEQPAAPITVANLEKMFEGVLARHAAVVPGAGFVPAKPYAASNATPSNGRQFTPAEDDTELYKSNDLTDEL